MKILITGGAGYIGSHVAKQLLEQEYEIIIIDNLSTGSQKTIDTLYNIKPFEFIPLDLQDFDTVTKLITEKDIKTIFHFAASIIVPESIKDPLKYYMNNTANTIHLIRAAQEAGVTKFIFSSTAAVYGEPKSIPKSGINERFETKPINPYGMSKLMSEAVLQDVTRANPTFKHIIFRYFNVAGADIFYHNSTLCPRIGQSFPNATHLIKVASECAVSKRDTISIFGSNYPTHDGTCVRDYIHVDDLASVHIDALKYLENHPSDIFNVGYGKGYSVKEVIETMKRVTCKDFKVTFSSRREGDTMSLISDNTKIINKMQWKPRYDDIDLICQSAYAWEKK